MSVNGEVYDVGTVVYDNNNSPTAILGIVLGIFAALVVGAALSLAGMCYFRRKNIGEKHSAISWHMLLF